MSKRVKSNRWNRMWGGTPWEKERWDALVGVPHGFRKDLFIPSLVRRMGCGKRRGEWMLLVFCFEGGTLPRAILLMGLCSCFVRGDFMSFIPSPLCHAFLPGNT
jgi:hypothetical protein